MGKRKHFNFLHYVLTKECLLTLNKKENINQINVIITSIVSISPIHTQAHQFFYKLYNTKTTGWKND